MQENANDGAGFNRYRYAANNPYRFMDLDGRQERVIPPQVSSRQKWSYAARANLCIGVMPPSAMFGRSWLYVQSQRVAVS